MTSAVSILDAVTPEPGYRFVSGVWCTHDLTVTAITDWLLPALVGIDSRERITLAAAPGHLAPGALLVCAAADRITTAGLLPDVVTVLPVHGRRQHAKSAVLRYEADDGPASHWYILTIITSANLTHGGVTRNRELVAVERIDRRATGQAVVTPVLSAIRGLRDDILTHRRSALTHRLAELGRGLPPVTGDRGVLHSCAAPPSRPFPARLANKAADRLLLIGPAFAADDSDVAALLDPLLGPHTRVDLVVDGGATRDDLRHGRARVRVPSKLLSGLRQRSASVTVHATPTDDEPAVTARHLHGKTVMVQYGDVAKMLVGSANITRTGLAGHNRELVVVVEAAGARAIDQELACVHAIPVPDACLSRVGRDDSLPLTVPASAAPMLAVFTPDPGQHFGLAIVSGVITVEGVGPRTVIDIDGTPVQLRHGHARVQLDPVRGILRVASGRGDGRALLVSVQPSDGDAFWDVPADIGKRRDDPLLALLRADVERAARQSQRRATGIPVAGGNDGFSLPGNVRLNVLVRHRNALARYDRNRQDAIVRELFNADPTETAVADAVVRAARGEQVESTDPVVRALTDIINAGTGGLS